MIRADGPPSRLHVWCRCGHVGTGDSGDLAASCESGWCCCDTCTAHMLVLQLPWYTLSCLSASKHSCAGYVTTQAIRLSNKSS